MRVHTGPEADTAARSIDAEAFTHGSDVVFRRGKYDPGSREGKRLMAHELTHVVQQEGPRAHGVLQRQATGGQQSEGAGGSSSVQLDIEDIEIKRMPEVPMQGPIRPMAPQLLNNRASDALAALRTGRRQSNDIRSSIGFLQYMGRKGQQAIRSARSKRAELTEALEGGDQRTHNLRKALKKYDASKGEIVKKAGAVETQQKEIKKASLNLEMAELEARIKEQQREKEGAKGKVETLESEKKAAKETAQNVIDHAANLLQGKWKEEGINLAKYIGGKLVDMEINDFYAPSLRKARDRLKRIKARLKKYRHDYTHKKLEKARTNLAAARSKAETAQDALITAVENARQQRTEVINMLHAFGFDDINKVITAKDETKRAAARVSQTLSAYKQTIKRLETISTNLISWYGGYTNYEFSHLQMSTRENLKQAAKHNVTQFREIKKFVTEEQSRISKAEKYVKEETYLKKYNELDDVFDTAVELAVPDSSY